MDLRDFFTLKPMQTRVYMIRNGPQEYLEFAQGQFAGSFTGTVTDRNGGVVTGTIVTLINMATNNDSTATTNGDGTFIVPRGRPTAYTIDVNAPDFKKAVVIRVQIDPGKTSSVDVDLEVGHVKETVTIARSGQQICHLKI